MGEVPYSLYTPETPAEESLLADAVKDMELNLKAVDQWPSESFEIFRRAWSIRYRNLGADDTATIDHVMELAEERDMRLTCQDKSYLKPGWEFGPHQYEEVFHFQNGGADHDCAVCQVCAIYLCEED